MSLAARLRLRITNVHANLQARPFEPLGHTKIYLAFELRISLHVWIVELPYSFHFADRTTWLSKLWETHLAL